MSWPASKVSKLENARQTPSDDDIRRWTSVTNSSAETAALLAALHTLEEQHAEWRRVLRAGLGPRQHELAGEEQKTQWLRVFETMVVPGLLQTAEYARARFAEGVRMLGLTDDIDAAVQGRMARQQILYRSDKRFHFVLTEAALRFRLCPPEVMLGQLDRLISLSQLPNVRLGVVAFATPYIISPWHGFWLHDNDRVSVETFSAALDLRQPQEVELYGEVFEQLAAVASYGRSARAIIHRVAEDLAQEVPEDGG